MNIYFVTRSKSINFSVKREADYLLTVESELSSWSGHLNKLTPPIANTNYHTFFNITEVTIIFWITLNLLPAALSSNIFKA